MILFSDDYSGVPLGNVALTSAWTSKGYNDFENSGRPGVLTILDRAHTPAGLLADPRFPKDPKKQVLRFTLPATDVEARVLWSKLPANTRCISVSWWEYRAAANLGGEKFCRVGNFVSGPGSNRGVDSIITLGQKTGLTLIANSQAMHDYGDQSLATGLNVLGLHHYEALYSLSTGVQANGSVVFYQNDVCVGQAQKLRFFQTVRQAATGFQLVDTGGWSSTGGGTEGAVKYPIVRYWCGWRVASARQGVWGLS